MNGRAARRVLIVEDNILVGEMIASTVHEGGFVPLGPCNSVAEADRLIDGGIQGIDAAILDVQLDGTTGGIAERLQARGVPFLFATGSSSAIPGAFRDRPVCEKPFTAHELLAAVRQAFEAPKTPSEACDPA